MSLSTQERAGLLKCRTAGRYDNLGKPGRAKPTPEEAAEEQWASHVKVPDSTWADLEAGGMVTRKLGQSTSLRLTDKGFEALGAPTSTTLIIIGDEGALRVTGLAPQRFWLTFSQLGSSRKQVEERVHLGSHGFGIKGRHLPDGSRHDAFRNGQRVTFYCRILPDDAREELAEADRQIEEAEKRLHQLRRERQDLLASAARRGKHVPMPPRTQAKPSLTQDHEVES